MEQKENKPYLKVNSYLMFSSETYFLLQLAVLVVCHGLTTGDLASQYFLGQRLMSWNKSREFCQTHYVDLAVLSTEKEYFHILDYTATEKVNFWLGLRRRRDEHRNGSWTWVDGEALHYQQQWWKNTTGLKDSCGSLEAMLMEENKMLPRRCDEQHAFVCQGPMSPQTVSVVSGSEYVILTWNISAFMQTTSHSYKVTRCSSTCDTIFYNCTKGSASISIHISNLTSATDYSFEISASVSRPDNDTGGKRILQGAPTTFLLKTEKSFWHYNVTRIVLKSFKVVFLAPPMWVFYLILKKGELQESDQDKSLMELSAEDAVVDIFPAKTREIG